MNCQICGSNEKKILSKLCANMDIMGPFFQKKESSIVLCSKCGSVYVDIEVEQSAFTDYYSSDYSKSLSYIEVFGEENAKEYYNNIEKRISQYVTYNDRILEVGGGIGELAEHLVSKGYTDITIMEPSDRCLNICKNKGIKTVKSDCINISNSLIGYYDFIIINHTLEHILEFGTVLQNVHLMLKDGGGIYIEVPDASMYSKTNFVPYWFFTYEHIVHMTLSSFDNLAKCYGFDVMEKASYLKCDSYYVMYTIMRSGVCASEPTYIPEIEGYIKEYIEDCENRIKPIVSKLCESKEPLILWGVGTSTAQLLNGIFDGCNVVKLVDSNPYRQNVEYCVSGRQLQIEDPSTIMTNELIVILPLMYDSSIRNQIKKMGLKNKVYSLIENSK